MSIFMVAGASKESPVRGTGYEPSVYQESQRFHRQR